LFSVFNHNSKIVLTDIASGRGKNNMGEKWEELKEEKEKKNWTKIEAGNTELSFSRKKSVFEKVMFC
jgi:hypothetical protein